MNAAPHNAWAVLQLADLRAALTSALDVAEAQLGTAIDLSAHADLRDYHWELPVDVAFAMDDDPGLRVVAGLTSDDLQTLAEADDPVWGHSLGHLAELLRLLAFLASPRPPRRRPAG
jgi:hypothetical protein